MRSSTGRSEVSGLGLERSVLSRGRGIDFVVGQHRVRVELLADLVDQLEARKLQQPNGLLQLRRHDQLLGQLDLPLDFHR